MAAAGSRLRLAALVYFVASFSLSHPNMAMSCRSVAPRSARLDLRSFLAAPDKLETFLGGIGLVWINGGNAFVLCRAMRQSGFDLLIKASVAGDEIVYAGFSAAAVIAFDSLKGLELTDDPNDAPSGYDPDIVWVGLGFVRFALAVHYKSDHSESVDREIAFCEASGIPYRTVPLHPGNSGSPSH